MKRLELLDYARLLAAVAVIFYHYFSHGLKVGHIDTYTMPDMVIQICKYGYLGVPFFFIISGYVIFFSALNRSAGKFIASRVTRLYPTFWTCATISAAIIYFWGGDDKHVTLGQYLVNLTMIPRDFGVPYIDGAYWTLHWELYFYMMVFVLLLLKAGTRQLTLFFQLWPIVMMAVWLMGYKDVPFLSGLYGYFAAGAVFAILSTRVTWLSIVALACSYVISMDVYVGITDFRHPSFLPVAGSTTLFFLFFFFINTPKGSSLSLPGSKLAGALTYPVYLLHQYAGYVVLQRMATEQTKFFWIFTCMAGAFLVALLVHLVVEKRMADLWRWLFGWTVAWPVDQLAGRVDRVAMSLRPRSTRLPVVVSENVRESE